jgi:hypothetical protein
MATQPPVGVSLWYYWKWSFMALSDKNGGCVAIDHWPEARTPHPTYISLTYITFLDFRWRPFLGQKSVGVSLRYYWKCSFMAISDKNGGCVAIDHRLEARTAHPTYVSFQYIGFLDFWWWPLLGQKSVGVSVRYYWKGSFMLFSTKMGVVWPSIIDQRLVHLTPHMFPCHTSLSWISGGDHFLLKNP